MVMAIEVEELIIQPFREVVERGKEAVANAQAAIDADIEESNSQDLQNILKSAQSLVREGERGLQRLLPLWKERLDKYGEAFTEAMRHNEQIANSQRQLEDLLYDLDDFVEVDTFDTTRFAEVRAASKSFALTLLEAIKRLHIEENTPSLSSVPSWIPPVPPHVLENKGRSQNGAALVPFGMQTNPGVSGTSTPARRPSSPDILGGERDFISLVSGPSLPPPASRTSVWVSEQTTAANSWSRNNSIPEDDCFVAHPVIANNLDSLTLQHCEVKTPSSDSLADNSQNRFSWYTATGSFVSGPKSPVQVPTSDQRTTSLAKPNLNPSTALELNSNNQPPSQETAAFEDGLMLAEELYSPNKSFTGYQIGLDSTLYLQKGFCPGAQNYRMKGRKSAVKSVMEYGTWRSLARCTDCEFVQSLLEVELDDAQESSGNSCKAGVLYRIRFLYKSHLITNSAFTTQFGCLFCAQKGHTVYPDDATVFTTQEQLFQHLSRHPQPLPAVPGIVVLYGQLLRGDPNYEDYDLHFPNPPVASQLPESESLTKLPAAAVVKSHVKRYGRDLLDPDGSTEQVIEFLEGSRVVGVEFPEKWKGKWCTGWHDGVQGSFPAKCIMLEPPAHLPGPNGAPDNMFVTTLWKWDAKDAATGWLHFDKDETLSSVSWLNKDDWCWYGVKKNGKAAGLFPRSHIKMESLREVAEVEDDDSSHKVKMPGNFHLPHLPTIKMRRLTVGSSTS